jgi:multicomponent K+:H+ antiporter subunit E
MAVATAGVAMIRALKLPKGRSRGLGAVMRLSGRVLADVVRSNIAVAKLVITGSRAATSGFVVVPLELRDPYGLATLACIITATPGTVWVAFNEAGGTLTIHVLDLVDEAEWIRTIKGRYERLLLEIFQ